MPTFLQQIDSKRQQNHVVTLGTLAHPYIAKALDAELDDLRSTQSGSRNDTLNRVAGTLGRLPIDRETLRGKLIEACTFNGLVAGDSLAAVEATINSGFKYADRRGPREIPGGMSSRPSLGSRLLTRSALRALPEPSPLIADTLDRGTVAHLYGKWGSGKSFIALDWAACVATGKPWQGRAVEQCRVLYVAAEGAGGYDARAAAWETGWQKKIDDDAMTWLPDPVNLTKPTEVEELCTLVNEDGYGFVVIDTLARCAVGADENSAKDMGIVIDAMTKVRNATPDGRGVVLDVHHAGKDGKTSRGSSALEAGVDSVYFIETDGAGIVLTRQKRKDGPLVDQHRLQLDSVGESCVVGVSRGLGTTDGVNPLGSIMSQLFVSSGVSGAELRRVALEDYKMSRTTYYRKRSELLKSGKMRNTGTTTRPHYEWCAPEHADQ